MLQFPVRLASINCFVIPCNLSPGNMPYHLSWASNKSFVECCKVRDCMKVLYCSAMVINSRLFASGARGRGFVQKALPPRPITRAHLSSARSTALSALATKLPDKRVSQAPFDLSTNNDDLDFKHPPTKYINLDQSSY